MKNLETLLQQVETPQVELPQFKQDLKQAVVLNALLSGEKRGTFKTPFTLAAVAATAFATLLVLFIWKPEVPHLLNQRLLSKQAAVIAQSTEKTPDRNQLNAAAFENNQLGRALLNFDSRPSSFSEMLNYESDQEFLRNAYQKQQPYTRPPANMQLEEQGVYVLRQYVGENGKKYFVITETSSAREQEAAF